VSTVLAVRDDGSGGQRTLDIATAFATLTNAEVRTLDLIGGTESTPTGRAERLLAALAEPDVALTVVSSSDDRRAQNWQILRHARKPVILVPPGTDRLPRTIAKTLIPLDGTRESAGAVAETVHLLARSGVEVIVLHVFDATTVPKFWDHPHHAERAWQNEFLARYCSEPGVHLQLRSGTAADHVLDVAAAEQVDLIALGWSRRLDAGHAHTLRRTLRGAEVPVLVIPVKFPG
jgi:nucleotide-binding universal stress UspA family protein